MGGYGVFDELVTEDMGAVRFSQILKAKLIGDYRLDKVDRITGDPAGDIRAQTDEETPFMILKANGLDAQPANTNDFVLRRESVAVPLTRLIDGKPGLIVDPRAKMLRKAMAGAYCLRRIQVTGKEMYRDMPDKGKYSHVAESLQYNMLGAGEGKAIIQRVQSGHRTQRAISDYSMFG